MRVRNNLSSPTVPGQNQGEGDGVPMNERAHRSVDLEQLDLELERGIGRDHRGEAPLAVCLEEAGSEVRRWKDR